MFQILVYFLCKNCNTPPSKRSPPLFPTNPPLKIKVLPSSPFGRRFTPQTTERDGWVHTMTNMLLQFQCMLVLCSTLNYWEYFLKILAKQGCWCTVTLSDALIFIFLLFNVTFYQKVSVFDPLILILVLTYFSPVSYFYTPWKRFLKFTWLKEQQTN